MTKQEFMKANRILNLHLAKKLYKSIAETLASNGAVQVVTYTRATEYRAKHTGMIRLNGNRVQVQSGKSWNTIFENGIQLVGIRFGKVAA